MKNFPFWLVIFIIPLLAFLGEAVSSHENEVGSTGQVLSSEFVAQHTGTLSVDRNGISVDSVTR